MDKPNPDVAQSDRSEPHSVYARYHAYLLRLWQESTDAPWRFQLESTATGERQVFSSLEGLFMYLDRVTIGEDVAEDVAEDEKQSAPPQEHLPRKD